MRRIFLISILSVLFVLPSFVSAQIPSQLVQCDGVGTDKIQACQACHAVQLAQTIIYFLVGIASFIAVIILCRAGFTMLTAGGNASKVTEAWGMFTNVAIGFVIVLAGWLIIDTVMKWAFQGSKEGEGSDLYKAYKSKFGPWNQINCVTLPENIAGTVSLQPGTGGLTPSGTTGGGKGHGALCNHDNPACSPAALIAAGYTEAKVANAMSCIAMTESRGIPTRVNPNGGACGTFQILPSNWRQSNLHQGTNCSSATPCTDVTCNAQTAYLLSKGRVKNNDSPYGDWTCPNCNKNAQACVDIYDPGGNSRRNI